MSPKFVVAWNNKAHALYHLGKYDEAYLAWDKATELYQKYSGAWYEKGAILQLQGKNAVAIQAYDKAIEANPKNARARNSKALPSRHSVRTKEAVEWKRYSPNSPEGNPYYDTGPVAVNQPAGFTWSGLPIAGTPSGNWHVDIYVNGQKIYAQPFTIAATLIEPYTLSPNEFYPR